MHRFPAQKSDANFLRFGLMDREAISIAYYPLVDELGHSTIGKNFADRPFIPDLKRTLQPMVSQVIMDRVGVPIPMVAARAPVIRPAIVRGSDVRLRLTPGSPPTGWGVPSPPRLRLARRVPIRPSPSSIFWRTMSGTFPFTIILGSSRQTPLILSMARSTPRNGGASLGWATTSLTTPR